MNGAQFLLGPQALARHGSRTALVCGEARLTYAELAARTARSAAALTSFGVRPGERVLLLMRDTPEFASAWLGAVHAGAVAVALNPKLSDAELEHVLADSAPRLVLAEDAFLQRVRAAPCASASAFLERARGAAELPSAAVAPEAPAFWLYSSGTTGKPKGVVHAHRAIASVGLAFRRLGIGTGSPVFSTSRLFFAYGLEHGLLAPLAAGASAILCPDWPDADAVIRIVEEQRPAAMFSVPTIYRRLLQEPPARLTPFARVPRFVAAGERMSPQLTAQWRAATGGELHNLYGMSETFCACMMTLTGATQGPRTGLPFDGVEVELRDSSGRASAPGEPGVLWVRHPSQALGYANHPELTRTLFQDGWFCSRDLFTRDTQGHYVHQGRADELIKVAGQWVQPGELEEVAAREAAVLEAACVPVADADGLERLALFVTAAADPEQARQAAAEACERSLPRHKRPKWIRTIDELPRTATGKVQRYKLREILERELGRRD